MSLNIPQRTAVYVDVYAGGTFDGAANLDLVDEGGYALTHSDGWRLRCQVRNGVGGDLIFTLAESGADGTILLDEWGHVLINLPSAFTTALAATTDVAGSNTRHHVGDLDVWNTAAPTVIYKPPAYLRVRVYPEVTTS